MEPRTEGARDRWYQQMDAEIPVAPRSPVCPSCHAGRLAERPWLEEHLLARCRIAG